MTPAEYAVLLSFVERKLSGFCGVEPGIRPTQEQLVDSIREVFPRMGWCMMRLGGPTEWGDYLLAALEMVECGPSRGHAEIRPMCTLHRFIACCAVLGWVDAPWALDPAPWAWAGMKWPGVTVDPPRLTKPVGWCETSRQQLRRAGQARDRADAQEWDEEEHR